MKTKLLLLTLFVLLFTHFTYSQQNLKSENWNWLIGEWQGEGSGQPGQGGGTFSFTYDLDNKIIIRKSQSEYLSPNSNKKIIHQDLMIIYFDQNEKIQKAIYFDNEDHIINYNISSTENSIILTSNKIPNSPVFRLSYFLIETNLINTKFEISRDGQNFTTYIEGKSKKVK